ncbi:MAG: hypothetical protein ABR964_11845 [Tepidisphaeraceae bacterium]|jgi:hypothetical protein
MKRHDPTFLLALFIALAAHALLLRAGEGQFRRDLGWWLAQSAAVAKSPTAISVLPPPPPQDPMAQIGEKDSPGKSINSIDGPQPMESAVADALQEQAMASREPMGFGRSNSARPLAEALRGDGGSDSVAPHPSALASPPAPRSAKPSAVKPAQPPVALIDPKAPPLPAAENPLAAGPLAARPPASQPAAAQQQKQQQQPSQDQVATGKPGSPDSSAGKPIPTANFESVPITTIASRFVAGKIIARTGRKMLTRQIPDLTLAGWIDVDALEKPAVTLRLYLDETGNVVRVTTIHTSGSESIDLPCERAAATWWFEPRKDPLTGKPAIDVIDFVILFK